MKQLKLCALAQVLMERTSIHNYNNNLICLTHEGNMKLINKHPIFCGSDQYESCARDKIYKDDP